MNMNVDMSDLNDACRNGNCCLVDSDGNCHDMSCNCLDSFFTDDRGRGFLFDLDPFTTADYLDGLCSARDLRYQDYYFLGY